MYCMFCTKPGVKLACDWCYSRLSLYVIPHFFLSLCLSLCLFLSHVWQYITVWHQKGNSLCDSQITIPLITSLLTDHTSCCWIVCELCMCVSVSAGGACNACACTYCLIHTCLNYAHYDSHTECWHDNKIIFALNLRNKKIKWERKKILDYVFVKT